MPYDHAVLRQDCVQHFRSSQSHRQRPFLFLRPALRWTLPVLSTARQPNQDLLSHFHGMPMHIHSAGLLYEQSGAGFYTSQAYFYPCLGGSIRSNRSRITVPLISTTLNRMRPPSIGTVSGPPSFGIGLS